MNQLNGIDTKAIAKQVLNDIDKACQNLYKENGHRRHLGASEVADACWRKVYYTFRWVKTIVNDGRQERLYNVGHSQEPKFIEWLTTAGFQVWDSEPDILHYHPESDSYFTHEVFFEGDGLVEDVSGFPGHIAEATRRGVIIGKHQFRTSFGNGHGGGSLDSIIKFPASYGIDFPVLGEYKTNGTGSGFNKLLENGVKAEKPVHYGQMCVYGCDPIYNFSHALYLNINKNDSDLHVEIVPLDHDLGNKLKDKAIQIINIDHLPNRISDRSTHFVCKMCDYADICFKDAPVEINCRSCKYAQPVADKKWFCSLPAHNAIIPEDFIAKGCVAHNSVNKAD